jgi:putative FmdB family regulatory protein
MLEVLMPVYEYLCLHCQHEFTRIQTLDEHENGDVHCPDCGSTDVEQRYAAFYAVTSRKSA